MTLSLLISLLFFCNICNTASLKYSTLVSSRGYFLNFIKQSIVAIPVLSFASEPEKYKDQRWPDIDGKIGWTWGGKDRCSPEDENCRKNGQVTFSGEISETELPMISNDIKILSRYSLTISIAGNNAGRLYIALWDGTSPATVQTFSTLCEGSGFLSAVDSNGSSVGAALFGPWSWDEAIAERIDADQQILFTKVKLPANVGRREAKELTFALQPPLPPNPNDETRYSGHGYLRVRRNPGKVEFAISCGAGINNWREWATIGHVEGPDEAKHLLSRLHNMAVNKYNNLPLRRVKIEGIRKL